MIKVRLMKKKLSLSDTPKTCTTINETKKYLTLKTLIKKVLHHKKSQKCFADIYQNDNLCHSLDKRERISFCRCLSVYLSVSDFLSVGRSVEQVSITFDHYI